MMIKNIVYYVGSIAFVLIFSCCRKEQQSNKAISPQEYERIETSPPCIEHTLDLIKEVFSQYEADDEIIFISPDYPERFKINCYGKKLLTLEDNLLGIPLEKENVPFLFQLSENLKIKDLHIVNKFDFTQTEIYLRERNADRYSD